jgi:hypothetical protein
VDYLFALDQRFPFLLLGLLGLTVLGALIALRFTARLGLRLVKRASWKAKAYFRRRRAMRAMPQGRTRREKLKSLGDDLEAAEKAELARLEAEYERTLEGIHPLPTPSGEENYVSTTAVGAAVVGAVGPLLFRSNNEEIKLNDDDNVQLDFDAASIYGALNKLNGYIEALQADVNNLDRRTSGDRTQTVPMPMPSQGTVAGRPRKEPLWHRQVLAGDSGNKYWTSFNFFDGSQNQPGHQTNLFGCGGLPAYHHFYLYGMSVRLDHDLLGPARKVLDRAKISFEFASSVLATWQLGHVLAKGTDGVDMTIMGRPGELNALESFKVRISLDEPLPYEAGVTVTLNGILVKGLTG